MIRFYIEKIKFYHKVIKWLWQHRDEENNRAKWRRLIRDAIKWQ